MGKDKNHSKTMILHSHTGCYIEVHLYQRYIISPGPLGNHHVISYGRNEEISYNMLMDVQTSLFCSGQLEICNQVWVDTHTSFHRGHVDIYDEICMDVKTFFYDADVLIYFENYREIWIEIHSYRMFLKMWRTLAINPTLMPLCQ